MTVLNLNSRINSDHFPLFSTIKWFFLSFLVFLLAACSSIQIGYNQGDTLLRWWIDDYFDLNSNQSELVSSALKHQFSWHRNEQLPLIQGTLSKFKRQLNKPLSLTETLELYQDIRRHSMAAIEHLKKDAAKLLLSSEPSQIKVMEAKFSKTNDKFRKDYLTGTTQQRLDGRIEKVIERTENIFGNLTKEQELQIAKLVEAHPLDMNAVYRERLRRQRDLLKICRTVSTEKPTLEVIESLLLKYIQTFEYGYTTEQKNFETERIETSMHLTAAITEIMTDAQRRYAQSKIDTWIEDVKVLSNPLKN